MSNIGLSLVDHIYLTYRALRALLALVCLAIPLGLILIGFANSIPIQESLSDYYYAESPPRLLRALFVGLLFLLGGLLISYRGFDTRDNWIHNLAGIFAWGVAVFPMKCPHPRPPLSELCYSLGPSALHYLSALLLFAFSMLSIYYNGGSTFRNLFMSHMSDKVNSFLVVRWLSGLIVAGGVVYALVMLGVGGKALFEGRVWIPESMGFIGFGLYWGALTAYIFVANRRVEKSAAETAARAPVERERPTIAIP